MATPNLHAILSRHKTATEIGKTLSAGGVKLSGWATMLFACCSDIPELLDYIEALRLEVADEIEVFAEQCATRAASVESEMTTCANGHNLGVVETYRQAANIARVGQDYRNTNCTRCRDTRGGAVDHKTEDCNWAPPVGLFEEHEQCYGRDLIQVGWMGPYGIIPGGMDNDPAPKWRPIFMHKVI